MIKHTRPTSGKETLKIKYKYTMEQYKTCDYIQKHVRNSTMLRTHVII